MYTTNCLVSIRNLLHKCLFYTLMVCWALAANQFTQLLNKMIPVYVTLSTISSINIIPNIILVSLDESEPIGQVLARGFDHCAMNVSVRDLAECHLY